MSFRHFVAVVVVAFGFTIGSPITAQDFGYESEVQPQRAVALPLSAAGKKAALQAKPGAKPVAKAKPVLSKPGAPAGIASRVTPAVPRVGRPTGSTVLKTVPTSLSDPKKASRQELTVECWSQIYQIASGRKLTADEHKRLAQIVNERPKSDTVMLFWPKVTDYLSAHPAQAENYAKLLKALLRLRSRTATAPGASAVATREAQFINEMLGPQRLAIQGTVAFSEDAVEAYADMACFLYEQNNPGKTIDAFDNRAMFASVVCEKFRNAPTDRDKQAMAAFDLAWAKFKIAWEGGSDKTKAELVSILKKDGAGPANRTVQDPVLRAVLDNWVI